MNPRSRLFPKKQDPAPTNQGAVPALDAQQSPGLGRRGAKALDAEMERELAEAMEGMAGLDLLSGPPTRGVPTKTADGKRKGKVIAIHGKDIFVEVPGGRSQGVIAAMQFTDGIPKIGDEIEFTIEGAADGMLLLSLKGAAMQADWSSVESGMIVEARVLESNKGGLSVDVNGIRAFMPISQIDLYRVEDTNQFINQRLRCMVVEVNPEERNLVVSRRALLDKEREEMREKTWAALAEGQVRDGIVRSVRDFGAFVDIGGVDGLLHVSEMSWQRVNNPETLVQVGQAIKVVILKIDQEKKKLSLGAKQLQSSPWDTIHDRFPTGTLVEGTVTRLMDFGAFVELEPAIEGLIHISELATQRVFRVRDVVQVGQKVTVKVLQVDPQQRRISLSLKATQAMAASAAATAAAQEEEEEEIPVEPAKPFRPRTTPLKGGLNSGSPLPTEKGEAGT